MAENILQVKNLKTYFHTEAGLVKAVNDVSFNVEKGKTLGIVGESGCGKSITSLSIMGLVERPGKIEGGEILFEGEDLLKMTEAQMRNIRGKKIAMIACGAPLRRVPASAFRRYASACHDCHGTLL